jgi:hypothetical protein
MKTSMIKPPTEMRDLVPERPNNAKRVAVGTKMKKK